MKRKRDQRPRKCLHCKQPYLPDPRTRHRQKHCSEVACQHASKAWRQRRWLRKPENREYFRGPQQVARVQAWREAHPGYWRKRSKPPLALQDDCPSQVIAIQRDNRDLGLALQDDWLLQHSLVVGLIAQLTGSALQDDIASTIRRMHAHGQRILGMGPGIEPRGETHDRQTSVVP